MGVVNLSGYFLLSGDVAFLLPFSSRLDLGLSVEVWQRGAAHRLPWAGTEVQANRSYRVLRFYALKQVPVFAASQTLSAAWLWSYLELLGLGAAAAHTPLQTPEASVTQTK